MADQQYSAALASLGGTWTEARLDAFLKSPRDVAPGTTMVFTGIADNALRAEIVSYLATLK